MRTTNGDGRQASRAISAALMKIAKMLKETGGMILVRILK